MEKGNEEKERVRALEIPERGLSEIYICILNKGSLGIFFKCQLD